MDSGTGIELTVSNLNSGSIQRKSEIRNPKQARRGNWQIGQTRAPLVAFALFLISAIRICFGFRISDFRLSHSVTFAWKFGPEAATTWTMPESSGQQTPVPASPSWARATMWMVIAAILMA